MPPPMISCLRSSDEQRKAEKTGSFSYKPLRHVVTVGLEPTPADDSVQVAKKIGQQDQAQTPADCPGQAEFIVQQG